MATDETLDSLVSKETGTWDYDYSFVDIQEMSDSNVPDTDTVSSFIEDEDDDGSAVTGTIEYETFSEVNLGEPDLTMSNTRQSSTQIPPTAGTPIVSLAEFQALQGQVSRLKKALEENRFAYINRNYPTWRSGTQL